MAIAKRSLDSCFYVDHHEVVSRGQGFVGHRFTDNHLNDLAALLRSQCLPLFRLRLRLDSVAALPLRDLKLGRNNFGAVGLRALVGALLDSRVHLRKLWLEKCKILAGGAQPVAELLEKAPGPLEELHLSHNFLDKGDVQRLLVAVARRREYPVAGPEGRKALWLRIEKQQVDKDENCSASTVESANWNMTQDMLREANEQCVIIRRHLGIIPDHVGNHTRLLCMVPWKDPHCSVDRCKFKHDYGPIVHLPYFWHQGRAFMDAGPGAPRPPEEPPATPYIQGGKESRRHKTYKHKNSKTVQPTTHAQIRNVIGGRSPHEDIVPMPAFVSMASIGNAKWTGPSASSGRAAVASVGKGATQPPPPLEPPPLPWPLEPPPLEEQSRSMVPALPLKQPPPLLEPSSLPPPPLDPIALDLAHLLSPPASPSQAPVLGSRCL